LEKLILFDIDGTLIDPGGIGRKSVTRAFYEVFSIEDAFSGIKMAGKTDIQIIKEALALYGLPSGDGVIPNILSHYVNTLKKKINPDTMRIKPGVKELLTHLSGVKGVHLGLLTGNIKKGARIKLGAFDLNGYFPFGAFGDDHENRNELLPIAIEKFRKMSNVDISFSDCVVIGDTPKDVQCSRPFGATSIAVSTGPYSYESLLKTGADYVLKDLSHAMELSVFARLPL
jgi:phosphoglycolate phosphatase-like HAD superfamily hydrolase